MTSFIATTPLFHSIMKYRLDLRGKKKEKKKKRKQ
jgi:hypothetical protein